jgi:hypothetical protein
MESVLWVRWIIMWASLNVPTWYNCIMLTACSFHFLHQETSATPQHRETLPKYEKRPGSIGLHRELYGPRVASYLLARGLNRMTDFHLASNMMAQQEFLMIWYLGTGWKNKISGRHVSYNLNLRVVTTHFNVPVWHNYLETSVCSDILNPTAK